MTFRRRLSGTLLHPFKSEKKRRQSFKIITGLTPVNLALYKRAMRHSSVASFNDQGIKDSYERLEYLGDAILGMLVAEFLFASLLKDSLFTILDLMTVKNPSSSKGYCANKNSATSMPKMASPRYSNRSYESLMP